MPPPDKAPPQRFYIVSLAFGDALTHRPVVAPTAHDAAAIASVNTLREIAPQGELRACLVTEVPAENLRMMLRVIEGEAGTVLSLVQSAGTQIAAQPEPAPASAPEPPAV